MDDPESVSQFHEGGTKVQGMLAVYDLSARALDVLVPPGGRLLDLGVGSGRALHRFLAARTDVTATAVDLAPNMLETARRFFDDEGFGERVSLVQGDITTLTEEVTAEKWDAISCVWCLHHLPDAGVLRAAVQKIASIRDQHESAVWILDFHRVRHPDTAASLLEVLEPDMPPVLHADALASVAAAWTQDELWAEFNGAGLEDLSSGVARPILWLQAFWSFGRLGRGTAHTGIKESLGSARLLAAMLRWRFSRLPF